MEENKRHIDDFLRDELGSYTETPPPAVWDELEKRLDNTSNRKGFDFRKWWWFIPVLLFVAGGTFLAAHKWNQQRTVPPAAAPVTDTASENSFTPDNVYKDTVNYKDTSETLPPVKTAVPAKPAPATQPGNTSVRNAAAVSTAKNETTADGNAPANRTPAANTGKTTNARPAVHNKKQGKTQNNTATEVVTGNNNATVKDAAATNTAATATGKQKKTRTTQATQQQAPGSTTIIPAPNDQPATQTTAAAKKTRTRSAPEQAQNNTPANTVNDQPVAEATAKPPKSRNTIPQPKDHTPAAAKNEPAAHAAPATKTVQKKHRRPAIQNTTVAEKNTTPAVNKAKTEKTVRIPTPPATAKAQKPTRPAPAAAAAAPERHRPESAPVQQVSPVTKDQEYNFKPKTETKETPKAKDNLDLSDKQAEAEADTAADREMDPYASLNPPAEKKKLHLEGGIKAAYSYGFNDYALNKITALPYVQLNINTKLSVALHLGFSYGQMNKTDLTGTQPYYKIGNTSLQETPYIDSAGGQLDTVYAYIYKQSRDSFSTRYSLSKTQWEVELPVVLKYNLSSRLSIFAGPVFTFGKVVQIKEDKSSTYNVQVVDSSITASHTQYNIAYFNNKYQPYGTPDSAYSSKPYDNPSGTPLRLGYTAGLSYNAGNRVVVDLSMQQMLTNPGFVPNETVRKVYTQPYFRLAIGFRIFK